jgi:glutaminyl-tRNA synthetase
MAVLNPVKLTLSNYPEGKEEFLEGEINPEQPELGSRTIPFSKHLLIEREDFKEEANRKFFRLTIDKEVRLKNGYIIKGESVIKDASGNITEIICTYDPESKSGSGTEASMRKVKGTLHWVSEPHALAAEVRLYDRLFQVPAPDQDKEVDFKSHVNPSSLSVIKAYVEPSLKTAKAFENFQFQRLGYFVVDVDSDNNKLVFNKTVGLRDTWAKQNN